jgi:CheY-like chemotaxis protein
MEIENIPFNIVETVESTVATFTPQADQKDIELGVFIDPFLSNYFLGDATKLSQILTNLIGNAIKFTDTYGKINIFVQSLHDKDDSTQIKFAVNDNGIGLSEEQRKNIFNAFSQASKNTSNSYGGTGLGLTISRQMVALMGGELEVESKPNNGSTFYFTITLRKDETAEIKPLPDFSDVSVGLALPVRGIQRQLDTNLEVYMKHLGANFSIHYYEDLFEGMGFINLPDIMIFDHHYARLAGELEQCLSLDCKSILLTNGTLRSRINPEKHHFDDILLRPIGLRKCIRILRNSREKVAITPKQSTELTNIESFEGLSALVADDNMINRKLIKIILEKIGLSVILSSDGKEAVEAYKKGHFDIIFMDIQMPMMDGIEATHKILEYEKEKNLKHIPIVALTANVAVGDKEKYLSEGMDDYATKPVEIDRLKSLIEKHTGRS